MTVGTSPCRPNGKSSCPILTTDPCPLILQTPVVKTIVAAGGFSDAIQTESPNPDTGTIKSSAGLS